MSIKYNLRSQQKLGFSLIFGMFAFIIILILSMVLLFPSSADSSTDFFLYAMVLAGFLALITAGVAYYFLKDAQLVIDRNGMRSTSKLLNLHPQFSPINFNSNTMLYKVEDVGKTMLGSMAKLDTSLQKNDTLFAFVDRHQTPKKVFMMSNNVWEIEDVSLLESQLNELGIKIETAQAREFIEEFIPQMADLGKKAGRVAYGSLLPFIGAVLILNYYDTWSTIYYGSFKTILWIVFLVSGLWALWYIKTNKKQLSSHIMISGLFGLCFTSFFLVIVLAIIPKIGEDLSLTFKYTEANDYKEEIWTATEDSKLMIYCKTDNSDETKKEKVSKPDMQKTNAKQWFSIIRVDGKKTLCPHGRYLSAGIIGSK